MKCLIGIFVAVAAPLVTIACHRSAASQPTSAHSDSPVHSISLPLYQPDLPMGPGRDVYASACLSCHSQRYIVMQPTMPPAKWEAVVRKMMTTYNAPVPEDQVAPIVKYIVAAREAAPHQTWDSLAVETPDDLPTVDLSHASAERGAQLFSRSCAPCHGPAGLGNGPGASAALPHPNNLTLDRMTPAAIYAAVHYGVRGASMPAATDLSPADITDIVAYTLTLPPSKGEPQSDLEAIEALALYGTNCVSCHGHGGLGDGPAAGVSPRRPANFHVKQPTADHAFDVITNGVPGTTMPAWKTRLDEKQRRALANYVRSFYQK